MIQFANPLLLLFCLLIPIFIYVYKKWENSRQSSMRFSNGALLSGLSSSFRVKIEKRLIYLRAFIVFLVIVSFSRPQSAIEETKINIEGIDIVLAVDVSTSMLARDFEIKGRRVDRLEVVKDVVLKFINNRPNDRIGLVAFSGFAYSVCPLTLDHDWLEKNLERVEIGMIEDGTAIGSAISASLNRIKDTPAKEKIVILLTDGRNNAGKISPLTAAEAAEALGVRIYTIGAGTKGMAPYPFKDMMGNIVLRPVEIQIDEELLKKIAGITGGEYFRATDTESLVDIYKEIDKLEKTPMEEIGYNIYEELFQYFLFPAFLLFLLEVLLVNTYLRRIP